MQFPLRPYVTAGVALTGAGLIAVTPIATHVGDGQTRAVALTAGPSDNAFTFGEFTFDPGKDGFDPIAPLSQLSPLLEIGGGSLSGTLTGLGLASQTLTVYGTDDTDLGAVKANVNVQDLLGIDSTQLIVQSQIPTTAAIQSALADNLNFGSADFTAQDLANVLASSSQIDFDGDITNTDVLLALLGSGIDLSGSGITDANIADVLNNISTADLPALGTVYSVTDLGLGFANVYQAIPGSDGGAATITDILVTPFGNIDLSSLFGNYDATQLLNPGDALSGLAAASGGAGDLSDNAFTVGGYTFDPGSDGFHDANPLFGIAPLLNLGGGTLVSNGVVIAPELTQDLNVYGSNDTDLGTVTTNVNTSDILSIDATQLTVADSTPADGIDADQLPAGGTVYSVANLGSGFANVYQAVPGSDGDAANITDTLVTPFGNADLSSLIGNYDATQKLDPGAALSGLAATDGGAGDLSDNAFTVGGFTFDPGTDGFIDRTPLFGIAPLLEIGGGHLLGLPLAQQDLDVYDDGTDLGTVETNVNVSNIFGIDTTELTVIGSSPGDGVDADQLPADGTVYSVTNLGSIENIYQAVPGSDGGAANITDTLVTPLGNIDLSSLFGGFDATADIDPGDVLSGLDFGGMF